MNVLSIDFDIIMGPDINIYNHFIESNGICTIDMLSNNFPMLAGCRADLYVYEKLVLYILDIIKNINCDDIYIAIDHAQITDFLKEYKNLNVYNIDHHHDLGYDEESENFSTCSNWGKYLYNIGCISNLIWIKNNNSEIELEVIENNSFLTYKNFFDIQSLYDEIPKIDKVFLCLSPEWVPENYHYLFYLILDLINKEKQCFLQIHTID